MNGKRTFSLSLRGKNSPRNGKLGGKGDVVKGHLANDDVKGTGHTMPHQPVADTTTISQPSEEDEVLNSGDVVPSGTVAASSERPASSAIKRSSYASSYASSDISGKMRATGDWFGSTDTDEETSMPGSPSELDWQDDSSQSMMWRAKQALMAQGDEMELPDLDANDIEGGGTHKVQSAENAVSGMPGHDRTILPSSATNRSSPAASPGVTSTTRKDAYRHSTTPRAGTSGILRRLRRINKREKDAVQQSAATIIQTSPVEGGAESSTSATESGSSTTQDLASSQESRGGVSRYADEDRGEALTTSDMKQEGSSPKRGTIEAPVREALVTERLPELSVRRQVSIHSIEASLVDVESDRESILPDEPPESFAHEMDETYNGDPKENEAGIPTTLQSLTMDQDLSSSTISEDEPWRLQQSAEDVADTTASASIPGVPTIDEPKPQVHTDSFSKNLDNASSGKFTRRSAPSFVSLRSDSTSAFTDATQGFSVETPSGEVLEDDLVTPRAPTQPERSSYFDLQSSASPTLHQSVTSQPHKASGKSTWLNNSIKDSAERHSLVKRMAREELLWELERLYLIRTSDELLDNTVDTKPRSDIAYLKAGPGKIKPSLPIIRLAFEQILQACPIFGTSLPMKGAGAARARAIGARDFFNNGILPLMRFLHEEALDQVLGDRESLFGAGQCVSVCRSLGNALLVKPLTRFVVSKADQRDQPIAWDIVRPPSNDIFLAHRVAPNKLRQGGYEVNVVGARAKTGHEGGCEVLLMVRRFGFPPTYVLRNDDDFYSFARVLAERLGPAARIRPVPYPVDHGDVGATDETKELRDKMSPLGNHVTSSKKFFVLQQGSLSGSTSSLQALTQSPLTSAVEPGQSYTSFGDSATPQKSGLSDAGIGAGERNSVRAAFARPVNAGSRSTTAAGNHAASEEARRKQLRAWLRDALCVQGAGHAEETHDFLQLGAFNEKELKSMTKRDIAKRLEIDESLMTNRKHSASEAPHEVLELRSELQQFWNEAVHGDGVARMYESIRHEATFSGLPLRYQQLISWMNLQASTLLFDVFLNDQDSQKNFERFKELVEAIPWKALSASLRGPTGLMVQRVLSGFGDAFVTKKILAVFLDDVPPKKVEQELEQLRKRLGVTILSKLEDYVASSAWQKKLVRQAAEQAEVPLVAAIVRGSNKPLLGADGIKRVVSATRTYQSFIATRPSRMDRKSKIRTNADVRLIFDMQRALHLLCVRRNGHTIRSELQGKLRPATEALIEPLLQLFKRLHRSKVLQYASATGQDVFAETHQFLLKLLDVLAGLRVRVQDPWRSLSTLVLLLDDAVPSWYRRLHHCARADSILSDVAQWLQEVLHNLKGQDANSPDVLASVWPRPPASNAASRSSSISGNHRQDRPMDARDSGSASPEPFSPASRERAALEAVLEANRAKRSRQMETACRWAAGDADADLGIQLLGEGGKTRTLPFELPPVPTGPSPKTKSALDRFKPGFRQALDSLLRSG